MVGGSNHYRRKYVYFYIYRGLFKHWLTSINWRSKFNLKFKKKQCMERVAYLFFFTSKTNQWCKKSIQKEKCSPEDEMHANDTSFSVFFFYKIMAPIFRIIHTWNKTLNPDINRGLERRCEVKRLLQGLLTFWHLTSKGKESPGTRLHKVWTGRKKVGLMHVFK